MIALRALLLLLWDLSHEGSQVTQTTPTAAGASLGFRGGAADAVRAFVRGVDETGGVASEAVKRGVCR